jgi:hypothetical protein
LNQPYRDRQTGQPITVTHFAPVFVNSQRTAVYEFTLADGTFGRLLSSAFNRQYERVEEVVQAEVGK